MAEIVETTSIEGSPDQVWAVLGDFGGIGRWAPNVDHSCLATEQSSGVDCVRRVQVGRNALLERVVDWQERDRISYAIEGLPPVVRSTINTWALEAHGDSTTVTLTTQIDTGPRPPQQIIGRALGKVMAKASREMLAGLKTHVEQHDSGAARS